MVVHIGSAAVPRKRFDGLFYVGLILAAALWIAVLRLSGLFDLTDDLISDEGY